MCIANDANVDVAYWQQFYTDCGHTQSVERGLLPFRVWQFFEEMVDAVTKKNMDRFVCAAGLVSHYVGDACQPLHAIWEAAWAAGKGEQTIADFGMRDSDALKDLYENPDFVKSYDLDEIGPMLGAKPKPKAKAKPKTKKKKKPA
jgi:hypothetical protein